MSDITLRQPPRWTGSGVTHPGAKRPHNEDAIFSCDDRQLWLVADGMGGHEKGDLASSMLVQALEEITATPAKLSNSLDQLEDVLLHANQRVLDYSNGHLQGATMGCTLAALLLRGHLGIACWAGDSRVYRLREGNLECLTRDHSRLQELVDRGLLQVSDIASHPEANIITRALGVEAFLQLDLALFSAQAEDCFLLCTDGLYNAVGLPQLGEILAQGDPVPVSQQLLQQALVNAASDNVSAIVVRAASRNT